MALVSTMSLTPVSAPPAVVADERRQLEHLVAAGERALEPGLEVASPSMLVRNPTRPKLTPRQGTPVPRQRCSARSIVPSPPSTTTRSGVVVVDDLDAAAGRDGVAQPIAARRRSPRAGRGSGSRPRAPPPRRQASGEAHVRSGRSTSAVWSSCDAGCAGDARYTRYSRFPAGPGTQESHTPRTAQPLQARDERAEIAQHPPAHLRIAHDAPAHIAPPGLELRLHQHDRAPRLGSAHASTAGSTSRSEMNETSAVTRLGRYGSAAQSSGARSSASSTVTRGSARSRSCSWFRPTSSATTAARAVLQQAVGEPARRGADVQAPLAGRRPPRTRQRRLELLAAARDVARRRDQLDGRVVRHVAVPGLRDHAPSTCTRPAMIRRLRTAARLDQSRARPEARRAGASSPSPARPKRNRTSSAGRRPRRS